MNEAVARTTLARQPDASGVVVRDGVRVAYYSYGTGPEAIVLLPSWTLVDARQWRAQVPFLARHCRVVTFDPRGNGGSDAPLEPAAFAERETALDALAVMDALGIERAGIVGLSSGALPLLVLAAEHPERVRAAVVLAAALPLVDTLEQAVDFDLVVDDPEGWQRYSRHAWQTDFDGFVHWFSGQIFSEPHSSRAIEYTIGLAGGTTGEILARAVDGEAIGADEARHLARSVRCPLVVVHGTEDRVCAYAGGAALAHEAGAPLVSFDGVGHQLAVREPVRLNILLRESLLAPRTPPSFTRAQRRARRALVVCSPVGLGHVRRDLAVIAELRRRVPALEVDWLAQHPVTTVLHAHGERVHPASSELASESAHWTAESSGHSLPAFEAFRRMDDVLLANYLLFDDVAHDGNYDLWLGDEAWDVDYFLHENPERKVAPYVWMTDFVGFAALPSGGEREAALVADYNAEMIEQVERFPRVRDAAIFVGEPADIPPGPFGPGLPEVRPWVEARFDFSGYITDPQQPRPGDRACLRSELGMAEDLLCVVAVGGSGVGSALLERAVAALPLARERVPGLGMLAVAGPRIDPASLPVAEGLRSVGHVDDLPAWLAACDVAVVQGGLSTCMELVAAGTPFVQVPLDDHFEQQLHVRHRLLRYGAGPGLAFAGATPERLAEAIVARLQAPPPRYLAIPTDGAARAADRIAPLLVATDRRPSAWRSLACPSREAT
jgi:pimeloyl-ACP methyl ester carboxylesterase/predicted glycosyltransferase